MNIEEFDKTYAKFKSVDKIEIPCDHPQHEGPNPKIGKQPARRNILKRGSTEFICRQCCMKHENPMTKVGQGRQTDEIIDVYCPHPEHGGDPSRTMKKACYYGSMKEPYLQVCGSCAQLGKEISEEQREKIRLALTGITRSDEFKKKLSEYMKNNPEGIARATKNIIENQCTTGMLGKHHSDETKEKMSEAMLEGDIATCCCGNKFKLSEGETLSPDPYAIPVCGECFEKAMAKNQERIQEEIERDADHIEIYE